MVQTILQCQFPKIPILEDTSFDMFGKFASHKDTFIQVFHGNHLWVKVEEGGGDAFEVYEVYDLLANRSAKTRITVQICQFRQCSKNQPQINCNSEQRQGSGTDFSVFAIIFVVELVFGHCPEKKLLEPNLM